MRIRYVILGQDADQQVIERWFVRTQQGISMARFDMYQDDAIKRVTVFAVCRCCGSLRQDGHCLNVACKTRQMLLPAPVKEVVSV